MVVVLVVHKQPQQVEMVVLVVVHDITQEVVVLELVVKVMPVEGHMVANPLVLVEVVVLQQ
tara:strand:- start:300 stop:482 length:183 start_codon:yes stop_codon:yes gene_type:complete